jgi:hypothetical protein
MRRFDRPGRSPVYCENGMATISHPLATLSAIDVPKRGGNAVNAAMAASATQGWYRVGGIVPACRTPAGQAKAGGPLRACRLAGQKLARPLGLTAGGFSPHGVDLALHRGDLLFQFL